LVLADIRDRASLLRLFAEERPEIVFHAAAYKHVPMLEHHPSQAITTNVGGCANVAVACSENGVERLVFVSTDKAVRPSSVMGASKAIGERIVLASRPDGARWCAVRFGNVLGSRGSVVPTFNAQIRRGGPLTITHPEMSRYFMTIPEAAQLVVQAGALDKGGEVFVLDMGEQVKIADLAREMVQLSGLSPGLDISIEYVGTRPGEKLYEELAGVDETLVSTAHPKILRVDGNIAPPANLGDKLAKLKEAAIVMDADKIRGILREIIPTYRPFRKPVIDTRQVSAIAAEGEVMPRLGDTRAER
jgi:FlaA1/EpsC-like NDP-sugar epimerase